MQVLQDILAYGWYIIALLAITGFIGIGAWLLRSFMLSGGVSFIGGREKRIGVVERATIDGRRLVLVRRDNVEHLIMIGGPIDLVVETGISAPGYAQQPYAPHDTIFAPREEFPAPRKEQTGEERIRLGNAGGQALHPHFAAPEAAKQ